MGGIDRQATAVHSVPGATLMQNAGLAVVEAIEQHLSGLAGRFVVLCGKGNNGGDGFVAARLLRERGADVTCLCLGPVSELSGDARTMHDRFRSEGGTPRSLGGLTDLSELFRTNPVVVDAIFGTGLKHAPKGLAAEVISQVNASGCRVVAVDIPSGVDSDTGAAPGVAVRAELTVTVGLAKQGLLLYPGRSLAGKVVVAPIGFPLELLAGGTTFVLDDSDIRTRLPARPADGHKGTFGTALVVAGSRGYSGAACLTTAAAVRSGCGLVLAAAPRGICSVVESCVPEAVKHPMPETPAGALGQEALAALTELACQARAVAIGPGIGTRDATRGLLSDLLPLVACPVVLDADALNLIAQDEGLLGRLRCPAVLTPHPGEFARLTRSTAGQVNADRIGLCRAFAREHGVVLVLKGASTVIAGPDGLVLVNPTGNSGLASGGTGDVLTGLLAGLLAQGAGPLDAAACAVFLHGRAADLAAPTLTEYCLAASDLLDYLPAAYRSVLRPDAV
jgi:NAD(P)H-hydrate epimerase